MELRKTHFPYCVNRLQDGRYILLNRNYKPLGIQSRDWVNYETDPSAIAMKITDSIAKKISCNPNEGLDRLYLYNDGCIPTDSAAHMTAYLKRLAVLLRLQTSAA